MTSGAIVHVDNNGIIILVSTLVEIDLKLLLFRKGLIMLLKKIKPS